MRGRRLIAVVGPTASGKSDIALELAERFGGEIVNSDSRQVYRRMSIGTAKPGRRERVPHHLYDVAEPDQPFSLAVYLQYAHEAVEDIWRRGGLPWLVGGTGQYVWALLEAWTVPEVPPDEALRSKLQAVAAADGTQALHDRLRAFDPVAADRIDPANVRRVIRAIEVYEYTGRPMSDWQRKGEPDFQYLILGVDLPDEVLQERIETRVRQMYDSGLLDEVRSLLDGGMDMNTPSMSSIGYREAALCLRDELSVEDAIEETITATRRLVRRQRQWFRKTDARIHWGKSAEDFVEPVTAFLGVKG